MKVFIKRYISSKTYNNLAKVKRNITVFINTPLKDLFHRKPIYIFHHLPKSGGTSVRRVISLWFNVVHDYNPGRPHNIDYWNNPIDLNKLKPYQCLSGHYEFEKEYLQVRYPQLFDDNKYRVFTFIRDPLQTSISLYYYWIKKEKIPNNHSLIKHLKTQKNFIANALNCNDKNYKEILNSYFFIGITENLQESLDILSKLIKRRKISIIYANQSKRDNQENLTDEFIDWFKINNSLDYKIYSYAVNRYVKLYNQV
jgi:hypothetical protein